MDKKTPKLSENARVCFDHLEDWARCRIQGFVQALLEEEVNDLLGRRKGERRPDKLDSGEGYRNGHGRPRKLGLTNGTIEVRRPRVRGLEERFISRVLPLFKRQSRQVRDLLPELYLHGLSSGDFELAMRGLLGEAAPLSPSSMQRLKAKWEVEFSDWKKRDLSNLDITYWWGDGLYVKAGIADRKTALLIIIGAQSNGEKIILAMEDGERESKASWLEVLRDLKARGLKFPKVTVADGHLGIWAALGEIHPQGDEQRCWNHKIVNVKDKVPRKEQAEAAEMLKVIPYADTRKECEVLRDKFISKFQKIAPKAAETLMRDWERMVTFYSYPKEHWIHLRTTNIVESPFNVVRLRTEASRRFKRVEGAKAMIWRLMRVAETSWRKLNSPGLLTAVSAGEKFVDGVRVITERKQGKLVEKSIAA